MSIVGGTLGMTKSELSSRKTATISIKSTQNLTSNSISKTKRQSSIESAKSERESLERIHTFSLKDNKEENSVRSNRKRGNSNVSRASSATTSNRSLSHYLPDKVHITQK
jgi:hypothetical protein